MGMCLVEREGVNGVCKKGSPQESDEMPILGRFPKRDEFGLRRGDALRFEEQVA